MKKPEEEEGRLRGILHFTEGKTFSLTKFYEEADHEEMEFIIYVYSGSGELHSLIACYEFSKDEYLNEVCEKGIFSTNCQRRSNDYVRGFMGLMPEIEFNSKTNFN